MDTGLFNAQRNRPEHLQRVGEATGRRSLTFDELKDMVARMRGTEPEVADLDGLGEFVLDGVAERRYIIARESGRHRGAAARPGRRHRPGRDAPWPRSRLLSWLSSRLLSDAREGATRVWKAQRRVRWPSRLPALRRTRWRSITSSSRPTPTAAPTCATTARTWSPSTTATSTSGPTGWSGPRRRRPRRTRAARAPATSAWTATLWPTATATGRWSAGCGSRPPTGWWPESCSPTRCRRSRRPRPPRWRPRPTPTTSSAAGLACGPTTAGCWTWLARRPSAAPASPRSSWATSRARSPRSSGPRRTACEAGFCCPARRPTRPSSRSTRPPTSRSGPRRRPTTCR